MAANGRPGWTGMEQFDPDINTIAIRPGQAAQQKGAETMDMLFDGGSATEA
ncbi:hypothetical protein ACQR1I_04630 [Bradyrhizobium sp. HKCCYLS2038]|uniref:hypothetical protein n=1 Tax=unclassified Bradyrhizobium TaxID=2631580 RepID=UPI003EBD5C21